MRPRSRSIRFLPAGLRSRCGSCSWPLPPLLSPAVFRSSFMPSWRNVGRLGRSRASWRRRSLPPSMSPRPAARRPPWTTSSPSRRPTSFLPTSGDPHAFDGVRVSRPSFCFENLKTEENKKSQIKSGIFYFYYTSKLLTDFAFV